MSEDSTRQTAGRVGRLDEDQRRLVGRLGQHLLCAAFGCNPALTRDADGLGRMLEELCERHGLTVLERFTHAYEPHGLTVGLVIGESHLILHTWPEHDLVHVDLFSCVAVDRDALLEDLGRRLEADRLGLLYDSTRPERTG
jgi:S-adenosylmethionine decarboxylase